MLSADELFEQAKKLDPAQLRRLAERLRGYLVSDEAPGTPRELGSDLNTSSKDVQAMETFRRSPEKFVKHLRQTRQPIILTVNGKAEAVLQDPETYQRLLDIAAQIDAREGIRQGLEDAKRGRIRPAREALEAMRRRHGIPR
jgi:PHD/YefM family antitoxin component YafN of YafNO toxin-antitoxin module